MKKSSRTITARIHLLSGQLEAIEKMVHDKRSCGEILTQISAVKSGLETVAMLMLEKELQKPKGQQAHKDLQTLLSSFIKST